MFTFPYVGGLFYLHEGPFVVAAVERLQSKPQLVCFDAHGRAHPRSAGLATIAGMVLGVPSVGIAKSLLVGTIGEADGSGLRRIVYEGDVVGFATGEGKEKRFWSSGYSVSLEGLRRIILDTGEACLKCLAEAHRLAVSGLALRSRAEPVSSKSSGSGRANPA